MAGCFPISSVLPKGGKPCSRALGLRSASKQGDLPRLWKYFAVHRDWCDHVLFYEDGTFAQGRLGGHGSWQLTSPGTGRASNLELELRWQSYSHVAASPVEVLSSSSGSTETFTAEAVKLELVSGEGLPCPGSEKQGPRALLFSSVGSQCLPVVREHWLAKPSMMQFDVALMFYKEASSHAYSDLSELVSTQECVELSHSPGMKWPNFMKWMEANGGAEAVAARYDYVWVVDDDVRLDTAEINRLFSILRDHREVEFACPSFDASSDGVWRYFDGHDPKYKLRYTDFIECTAPVLKTTWLTDPGFARCLQGVRTGCFIDFCFFPAAGRRRDAVAVIDAVQCHHPPRGADAPSEMRQVQAWEDHKEDDVYFDQAGVPRDWYWFRQPQVFGGVPAEEDGRRAAVEFAGTTVPVPGSSGVLQLPSAGFGTAFYPEDHLRGTPEEALVCESVDAALRAGVRLFDCANQYTSQRHVGAALERALQTGLVSRDELVVVTKLAQFDSHSEVVEGVQRALGELRLDYVDVLMPHIPCSNEGWRWFEEEVDAGRVRHLGISNYDQLGAQGLPKLKELLLSCRIRPAVHEFELHPLLQNREMVEFCQKEGIQILSYSPLGAPHKVQKYVDGISGLVSAEEAEARRYQLSCLDHPATIALARRRGVSPAQLVLSWHFRKGFVPIPKSWDPVHIKANCPGVLASLVLEPAEMNVLEAMDADVRTILLYKKGTRREL